MLVFTIDGTPIKHLKPSMEYLKSFTAQLITMPLSKRTLKPEKYLRVAELLKQGAPAHEITRSLKVQGQQIGVAKALIDAGVIVFDESGPSYSKTPEEVEAEIDRIISESQAKSPSRLLIAQETIAKAVEQEIASNTTENFHTMLTLGKVVWQVYADWAAAHGYNIAQIEQNAPHIAFKRALEKEAKYDALLKENQELREKLAIYEGEIDPLLRYRKAAALMNRFIELGIINNIMKRMGYPPLDMRDLAQYYGKLVSSYMKGGTVS
jgi:hypothetical protein